MRRLVILLSLSLLAGLIPAAGAAEPAAAPATDEKIELPKFQVQGTAICSFGVGVMAIRDKNNATINRLFITDITPDSPAERLGLKEGDEILSLNGKKISAMKGGMKHGSDLFELLVNQHPGKTIDVELAVRVVKHVTLTALP